MMQSSDFGNRHNLLKFPIFSFIRVYGMDSRRQVSDNPTSQALSRSPANTLPLIGSKSACYS
jgi:hypothetical protein